MKYKREYIGEMHWADIKLSNSILVPKTKQKKKYYCFYQQRSLTKDNKVFKNYDCYLICG